MSRREADELAEVWLERCDISDIKQRFPHELSGGQKQRVAIVRALIMNPSLVLMDEVTSALDVETADRLLRLFESLKDGKRTFVFVSHHLNFVERATDRTVVLIDGRIAEVGDSRSIVKDAQDPRTRQFLSTVKAVR
jgi:polar amino acid transport system ATP-binding protein